MEAEKIEAKAEEVLKMHPPIPDEPQPSKGFLLSLATLLKSHSISYPMAWRTARHLGWPESYWAALRYQSIKQGDYPTREEYADGSLLEAYKAAYPAVIEAWQVLADLEQTEAFLRQQLADLEKTKSQLRSEIQEEKQKFKERPELWAKGLYLNLFVPCPWGCREVVPYYTGAGAEHKKVCVIAAKEKDK